MADQHELISDLKRLAADLGRTPTRDEYSKSGKFSRHALVREFGSFAKFLNAAGFENHSRDTSGGNPEKKYEREIQSQGVRDNLRSRFDSEIAPFVGKYTRDNKSTFTLMYRSDDHAQWCDPFCDAVFKDVAKRIQPDYVVFAGDTVDFYQISSHGINPRRQMTLQSEINYVKVHMFEEMRTICPSAEIDWMLGNHEMRLFRYLCDKAPGLSTLDCLSFDKLFDLDKYQINLIARRNFLNPRAGKDHENYKIYNDSLVITHGTSTGANPALAEFTRYGMSGISGHVHRHTYTARKNLNGLNHWMTAGAMCSLKSGEEYIPDLVNWQNGFIIVHVCNGKVYMENVDLTDGFACIGGVYYRRKDFTDTAQGI